MWFKYYKGYYDVRKLELELVSVSHHIANASTPTEAVICDITIPENSIIFFFIDFL